MTKNKITCIAKMRKKMENYKRIASINDLNDGEAKKTEIDDKKIALFRIDGEYFAIDDTCTHEKASLSEGENVSSKDVSNKD